MLRVMTERFGLAHAARQECFSVLMACIGARSHLAMQGATAKAIQELAGHQDLTTTQRYMHLSPAHKDAAIRLLDRRPEDDAPLDSATPAAPLRSGRAEVKSVGDGLETGLRPEPESSRSE